MKITIEGVDEWVQELIDEELTISEEVERAVSKIGFIVEADAKLLCPVGETGNLRRSIRTENTHSSGGSQAVVGTNVEYAPYVEFGTSRMKAQPYLTTALTQNEQAFYEAMDDIAGRFGKR